MASTITAGNATNGLALSCDNTGILELKTGTGAGTTAITADASQNVTVAGTLTAPSVIPSSSTAPTNGVFLPAANTLGFSTASTERARIDSSGNLLVTNVAGLGYGTGSGGTVTQATSKSTGVTLNKPTGKITTSNSALAANTTTSFTLTNSIVGINDTVVVNTDTNAPNADGYIIWATAGSGQALIRIRNMTGGSLSDALTINFAIIKGATS